MKALCQAAWGFFLLCLLGATARAWMIFEETTKRNPFLPVLDRFQQVLERWQEWTSSVLWVTLGLAILFSLMEEGSKAKPAAK
jgi:hypothetical protein